MLWHMAGSLPGITSDTTSVKADKYWNYSSSWDIIILLCRTSLGKSVSDISSVVCLSLSYNWFNLNKA